MPFSRDFRRRANVCRPCGAEKTLAESFARALSDRFLPIALPVDPLVWHAEALQGVEDGLEEARLGLLAPLLGRQAVEPGDAGAAGEDLDGRRIGNEFADQGLGDPAAADVRRDGGEVLLPRK